MDAQQAPAITITLARLRDLCKEYDRAEPNPDNLPGLLIYEYVVARLTGHAPDARVPEDWAEP